MKKFMFVTIVMLILALAVGCTQTQSDESSVPTGSEIVTEPTEGVIPEDTTAEAESPYADNSYAQQLDIYYTAISQRWDDAACAENQVSPLVANYYEGTATDNVGFAFVDLDNDGSEELVIGAIQNAQQEPLVFEVWTLKDGQPVMLAQSNRQDHHYLQYADEDELWSVSCEATYSAEHYAVYHLQLVDGELSLSQAVTYNAADANGPWFRTYDMDMDTSNDSPEEEDLSRAIIEAGRRLHIVAEYIPYSQYK